MQNNNNNKKNRASNVRVEVLSEQANIELSAIYSNYCDMIAKVAKRFKNSYNIEDNEDLSQIAWEGIIRRYHTFDKQKSCLGTWLTLAAMSAIKDSRRKEKSHKRIIQEYCTSFKELRGDTEEYED